MKIGAWAAVDRSGRIVMHNRDPLGGTGFHDDGSDLVISADEHHAYASCDFVERGERVVKVTITIDEDT